MSLCFRRLFLVLCLCLPIGFSGELGAKDAPLSLEDLRPTQLVIGREEVRIRQAELEELVRKEGSRGLDRYLRSKPLTVVKGPGDRQYLVDGHHLVSALLAMGKTEAYGAIVEDWSDLSPDAFWKKMEKKEYFYLYDERGRLCSYRALPAHISDLRNDPYRTLAWLVRKTGGFENLNEPYQEFRWANFFRSRIRIRSLDAEGYEKAVVEAIDLVRTREARALPGAWEEKTSCKEVLAQLSELTAVLR